MRSIQLKFWRPLLVAALLVGAGCEDNNDNDFNHDPPAGQGSLIVDNQTPDDFKLYVDGIREQDVRDGHWEAVDLTPGVRRAVLVDEDANDRSYANDVDILEGQQTIIRVTGNTYGGNSLQFSAYIN